LPINAACIFSPVATSTTSTLQQTSTVMPDTQNSYARLLKSYSLGEGLYIPSPFVLRIMQLRRVYQGILIEQSPRLRLRSIQSSKDHGFTVQRCLFSTIRPDRRCRIFHRWSLSLRVQHTRDVA
jgi:hypothetical protein